MPDGWNKRIVGLLICGSLAGCVSSGAPGGFLPDPKEALTATRGGWIHVTLFGSRWRFGKLEEDFVGELIAAKGDSVHVLVGPELVSVPVDSVLKARLFYYDSHAGELGLWTTLGFFASLSHGWYLAFSAPSWLLVGGIASNVRSRQPIVSYNRSEDRQTALVARMAKYARFPQGLPPNVSRQLSLDHRRFH